MKDWTRGGRGVKVFPAWMPRTVPRLCCAVPCPEPAMISAVPVGFVHSGHSDAMPGIVPPDTGLSVPADTV